MNDVLYHHGLIGSSAAVGEWVRPVDWLPMPATVANSIDILAAVFNHDSNYCAVKISTSSGTYNVDWGDGTTSTGIASGVQADHTYTYSSLAGTDSVLGYRQAKIRITPATGSISAINLNVKNARAGLVNGGSSPWLDIAVNAPSATAVSFYSSAALNGILQRVKFIAIGTLTSLASAFLACLSLRSVTFPNGSLSDVTSLSSAFQSCVSLQSVTFPAGSLSSVITISSAFNGCYSLRSVTFPDGSLIAVASTSSAFTSCGVLTVVNFPSSFATTQSADTSSTFASCASLASVSSAKIYNTFSVASCRLSGAALNSILTALPTVTGKTITVTGNHGVPDCTPSIATAKGWTVVT